MDSALHRSVRHGAVAVAVIAFAFCGRAQAVASVGVGVDATPRSELQWRRIRVAATDDVIGALALDGAGRLAVGDARGVAIGLPGSPMRRVALRGEVRDLAFYGGDRAGEAALLAATPLGLYRILSDGRVESISPGPGPAANAVARIAIAGRVVAAATDAGAFASLDGTHWQRLSEELPSGPATAIALAERGAYTECWVAIRGDLWRSEIRTAAGELASTTPVRVAVSFGSSQRPPVDIALDVGDAAIAVVFASELVVRAADAAGWERLRPTLPPGAAALRLAAALDRFWLATDRGLLVAPNLRGPWSRAHDRSGSDAIFDLEAAQGVLYVATDNGLALAQRAPDRSAAAEVPRPVIDPSEPGIQSVHRAAIRYLNLEPARIAELRRGVARRGWLPILSFRATRDRDRRRHFDYDEAFVSGEMRRFNDWDADRDHALELQLAVSWDFGDIAYHPESIDVSREAREIIELRDDVLDEITQLYFERRRVLAELAIQPEAPAAIELQLRAAQLAAQIDAWTGGWYARELAGATP